MSKTFFIFSSILKVKDYCLVYQENLTYNINRFDLQESGDFIWRVSDCEELVGIIHRGMMLKENCQRERSYYRENVTPLR